MKKRILEKKLHESDDFQAELGKNMFKIKKTWGILREESIQFAWSID